MIEPLANPVRLLLMLPGRPREFWERSCAIVASKWQARRRVPYRTAGVRDARNLLSTALDADLTKQFLEPALVDIRAQVRETQMLLCSRGAFHSAYNADSELASFCYAVTRALQPKWVVETGVCYGVTSAHILKAMELNNEGHLDSIDLPPLGKNAEREIGRFIPEDLRTRWTLHRGRSERVLRPLLHRLGTIDLFVHDSQHTYRNMKEEFAAVWPFLRPGGVLISDDIQGNTAFQELVAASDAEQYVVVEERGKDALFGVVVKA